MHSTDHNFLVLTICCSALSLRLFGEDITFVGRQAQAANSNAETTAEAVEEDGDGEPIEEVTLVKAES